MSKNDTYFIWVIITAIILSLMVYVYYEKQIDAMEKKIKQNPP